MNRGRCLLVILILAGVILLAACADDESASEGVEGVVSASATPAPTVTADPAGGDGTAADVASPLADLGPPASDEIVMPDIGRHAALLLVFYDQLIFAPFAGYDEETVPLGESVSALTVELTPDSAWLAFAGRGETSRNAMRIYSREANAFVGEYPLPNNSRVIAFSHSGEWFALATGSNLQVRLVRTDGSEVRTPEGLTIELAWLEEGGLIYFERGPTGIPLAVWRYDPETDTRTELDIPFDDEAQGASTFDIDHELGEMGLHLSPNNTFFRLTDIAADRSQRVTVVLPGNPQGSPLCATWTIQRSDPATGTSELLYVAEDTHALSDIDLLPDGSVVVLRWYRENCSLNDILTAELLHIQPDGSAESITRDVFVDEAQLNVFTNNEQRMAAAPDGRFVATIAREGSATAVDLHDLATDTSARIFVYSQSYGRDIIQSVAWATLE